MILRSLRARLLLGAAAWTAAALAATWLLLHLLLEGHLRHQLEAELAAFADELLARLEMVDGSPRLDREPSDPRFRKPLSGLYWQIEVAGRPVLRSRSLWDEALRLPADVLADGELHRHGLKGPRDQRLMAVERSVTFAAGGAARVAVASDLQRIGGLLRRFNVTLAAALAALAAGLLAAVWTQVGLGLRPLVRLRAALGRVHRGEQGKVGGSWPSEIAPLVDDLDALLAAQHDTVARSRTLAGNLAHGLKTPLSVIGNGIDRLAPSIGVEDAETLRQQMARMRRLIDYHLARARAAGAAAVPGARCEAGPRTGQLLGALRKIYADRPLDVAADLADRVAAVEPQDFDEMAGNLLDNAFKWAGGRLRVRLAGDGTVLLLVVEDDGPGLPEAAREQAFERGRRLDESVPGSGLGLAIVRDVAGLYGGTVALGESELGGLRAELRLPAAISPG